jgi:hypothetical protein
LEQLADAHRDVLLPLVKDVDEFITVVKDTRNHLTHYTKNPKAKVVKGADLDPFTRSLEFLLIACLLVELGIPNRARFECLRRNRRYVHAAKQAGHDVEPKME